MRHTNQHCLPYNWPNCLIKYEVSNLPPVFLRFLVMVPIALIFMATEPPTSYYMQPGGDIHIGKSYKMNMSKKDALTKLRAKGYQIETDSSQHQGGRADHYVINNLVLDGGKYTIQSLQFGFLGRGDKPSSLLINDIKLRPADKEKNMKLLKKSYQELIKSNIIEEVN